MTTQPPDLKKLRELAEKATPQNFDSAQIIDTDGWVECPCCSGEGSIELSADYCNYDGEPLGVQFYGIGDAPANAEAFYRAFNPQTILALLDAYEASARDADVLRGHVNVLVNAGTYLVNRVVETKGVKCMDDMTHAIDGARHATQGD
ncbi:ead/Ea22-like family protein [Dyella japonica]|uniref:Uncharacterized protein n=1 Tax=Dyella japonica TaxID=231455 RepID=A0ABV2JYZ8_9GAMM